MKLKTKIENFSSEKEKKLSVQEKREKLLQAGINIFAKKNYMRATTKEIAAEAGMSEGNLYKHFPSKEKLFIAIINYIGEKMLKRWEAISLKEPDPFETLYKIGITHYDKILKNKAYTKLIFQAISEINIPEVKEALQRLYTGYADFFSKMLEKGKEKNLLEKGFDSETGAWNLISIGFTLNLVGLLGINCQAGERFSHNLGSLLFKAFSEKFYKEKYKKTFNKGEV